MDYRPLNATKLESLIQSNGKLEIRIIRWKALLLGFGGGLVFLGGLSALFWWLGFTYHDDDALFVAGILSVCTAVFVVTGLLQSSLWWFNPLALTITPKGIYEHLYTGGQFFQWPEVKKITSQNWELSITFVRPRISGRHRQLVQKLNAIPYFNYGRFLNVDKTELKKVLESMR